MAYFIACGDRNWRNVFLVRRFLDKVPKAFIMLEGECPGGGADILAKDYWDFLGLRVKKVPALWRKYGKRAGPIRNSIMINHEPIFGLAFHSNLENSKGTKDVVTKMERKGIPVIVVSESNSNYVLNGLIRKLDSIICEYLR